MKVSERLEKLKADLNGLVQYSQKLEHEIKVTHEKIVYFQGAIEGLSSLTGDTNNVISILAGEGNEAQETNDRSSSDAGSDDSSSLSKHAV